MSGTADSWRVELQRRVDRAQEQARIQVSISSTTAEIDPWDTGPVTVQALSVRYDYEFDQVLILADLDGDGPRLSTKDELVFEVLGMKIRGTIAKVGLREGAAKLWIDPRGQRRANE